MKTMQGILHAGAWGFERPPMRVRRTLIINDVMCGTDRVTPGYEAALDAVPCPLARAMNWARGHFDAARCRGQGPGALAMGGSCRRW